MVRSFLKLYRLDLGIETGRLLTMRLVLAERKYPQPEQRVAFYERLTARLDGMPGVAAASVTTALPLNGGDRRALHIDGRPTPAGERVPEVTVLAIGPRYFDAIGLALRHGRALTEQDGRAGAEAAIVNERLAAQFFPGQNPIGRRIRLKEDGTPESAWLTIVGLVPNVRQRNFQQPDPDAIVYVPYRMEPERGLSIVARTQGDPTALTNAFREAVRAVDPDLPVFQVFPMDHVLAQARWPFRVFGSLFAIFALIALLLSGVGLYAVTAYSVTQRTQEIGVRMALGAQPAQVSWLILRQGLLQLAIGLTIGMAGAFGVGRLLQSLLVQTSTSDPVTFGSIAALLVGVSVMACLVPARRATALNPVSALRSE